MKYDVVVIGSGPGGYVAAIRCSQLGMKAAVIERYPTLGGTCLNVGCIPSKALLDSSEHYYNARKHFTDHGIEISGLSLNVEQMFKRKNEVVSQTSEGIRYLMKKNQIDVYEGHGSFVKANTIMVAMSKGTLEQLETKYTIIATGSKPSSIPNVNLDKERVITSTEALKLSEIPKEMIIIGGGVIGLELGSVYARLGTEVKIIEYFDRIIPTMDSTLSKELLRSLKKMGMKFYLSHTVQKVTVEGTTVTVVALDTKKQEVSFTGDYCLVSVGRRPYTQKLGLENVGIIPEKGGQISVNEHLETSVPGIYAIGDVIKGPMLAHKAEEEGLFVAETIAGQKPHINYNAIPGVVYTWPEVASVGYSEDRLKEVGRRYKVGSFPFRALGRARAAQEIDGLVKILADEDTDEILGVHMIGARVADLIAEAVVALEYRASAEDISRMSHAHPTFAEAIKEAALDATGKRSIHL
ncbi:dihydrolipoyl dehydrogenase [Deltaproteobacteria bacterium TL4]